MVSGDNAWGLNFPAQLEVDYAAIFDDGIQGVNVGSKVDVYVRSVDQLSSSSVDLADVDRVEYLNASNGFTVPISSVDAVFLVDGDGEPVGDPLVEGVDYALTIIRPELRFSAQEHNALTFSAAREGMDVRVYYTFFQYLQDVHDFVWADANNLPAADTLVRAFIPVFVDATIEAGGFGISDADMESEVSTFLENLGTTVEISDLIAHMEDLGASTITTPLTLTLDSYDTYGQRTVVEVVDQHTLELNQRLVPRTIAIVRI